MTTEVSSPTPKSSRARRWAFWTVAVVVFLVPVGILLWQFFGPSPPIVVSPETTYITEPLGPDGLPDFEQYLLDQYPRDVAPEDNAAVLLLEVFWPADIEPKHRQLVIDELGLDPSQLVEDAYDLSHLSQINAINDWIENSTSTRHNESSPLSISHAVREQAGKRPWVSKQIPPLAQWVQEHQEPLDLLVEASQRSAFYAPPPTLINNERDVLFLLPFPYLNAILNSSKALVPRSMQHLGEGRIEKSWQDILASYRLSKLMNRSGPPFLINELVAYATNSMTCDAATTFLHYAHLPEDKARKVHGILQELPDFSLEGNRLVDNERIFVSDLFLAYARQDLDEDTLENMGDMPPGSVDWNQVLRERSRYFNRIARALEASDQSKQDRLLTKIEKEIETKTRDLFPVDNLRSLKRVVSFALNRSIRSERLAATTVRISSYVRALERQKIANTELALTRLSAALAIHRAEHGAYPSALGDLVPGVLDALAVDDFSGAGETFRYQRKGEGYLLYSVGPNGSDDAGSKSEYILNGIRNFPAFLTRKERIDLKKQIPPNADDIAIRVPKPDFLLPKPPSPGDETDVPASAPGPAKRSIVPPGNP